MSSFCRNENPKIKHTTCGIFLRRGKLLLGKRHDDEDNYAGLWDIPSGHVEDRETIEDALRREMKEEIGVKIGKFKPAFVIDEIDKTSGKHYNHHCFYVISWKGEIKNLGEFEKIGWFTGEEAQKMSTTFSNLPGKYVKKLFAK